MPEEDTELELLLSLDGRSYEAAAGYMVEFLVRRTAKTAARPHGISYSLVFRPKGGKPYVRFDNAHRPGRTGGRFAKRCVFSRRSVSCACGEAPTTARRCWSNRTTRSSRSFACTWR